jgi:anti-sigma-K factor RskA
MNQERLLELVPLAALGALDGEERAAFEAALASSPELQRELAAYRELVGRLGLAAEERQPPVGLRERVLATTRPAVSVRRPAWLAPALAASLMAALAGLLLVRSERDTARRELLALRETLASEVAFRDLVGLPETRVVDLAGLEAAPDARARVVWHSGRREGVLLASGLAPTASGKAYELWLIASGAPVPAGVFRVDASGRAVLRLPPGLDFAGVKTFAVTVEPEAGVAAPTGAMVLAGSVS